MALVDNNSILMSIKNLLNVEHNDPDFDTQIGMEINGVFMTLWQLGIGPKEGFAITEANTQWSDFSKDKTLIETVKMYMYLKVRLIFDPPASSIVSDAINSRINELEWRLNLQAEKSWENYPEESKDSEDELPDEIPETTEPVVIEPENPSPTQEPISSDGVQFSMSSTPESLSIENQNGNTRSSSGKNYKIEGESMVLGKGFFQSLFSGDG